MSDEKVWSKDLEALAKAVQERICEVEEQVTQLASKISEPAEVKMRFYRCTEEGCAYVTEDLGAFIEHTVDERLKKLPLTSVSEGIGLEVEEPMPARKRHTTVADYMDCPECAPKFEKAFEELGWEKPEPKPKSGLNI